MRHPTDERLVVFGVALFFLVLASVVATAWDGLLTLVWHPGIHLEQTSVAVNYAHHGVLTPFSLNKQDIVHLPPLYSWFVYAAIQVTGWIEAGRIVSVLAGVATIPILYLTVEEFDTDWDIRLGAPLFLATSPLFVLLGGAIMQETLMVFFSTLAMYLFARYVTTGNDQYLLGTAIPIFLSAFAKWPGIFTLVPIGLFLLWEKRWGVFRYWQAYAVAVVPVGLSLAWFVYISHIAISPPSGNITSRLLFAIDLSPGSVVKRLVRYWITRFPVTHLFFALVGVTVLDVADEWDVFVLAWLAGTFAYVVVFLRGAVYHDHYAALMLPSLAVLAALGLGRLSTAMVSRLQSVTRGQVVAVVWVLLLFGITIGVAGLSVSVRPETQYVAGQEDVGQYVVSGAGNRKVVFVAFPDTDRQPYPREVDTVASHVDTYDTSHVGFVTSETLPVYYRLSGNHSKMETYSSPPGSVERYGSPSSQLLNDSTPADIVVAPKRSNWDGSVPGYEIDREFPRFYVLTRTASSSDSSLTR